MNHKTFKCQVCPVGCSIEVTSEDNDLIIKGNNCNRGLEYARSLYEDSPQVLFGRCILSNSSMGRLAVKTSSPIPKEVKSKVMKEIQNTRVSGPIKKGQVIIENIFNLGVDVVAMRKVL